MSNQLKCPKCGYEWNYKGSHEHWATCPNCLRKVKLTPIKEVKEK
jgi:tRNA(Ile2) C34 agmatinyltransferase TiaS